MVIKKNDKNEGWLRGRTDSLIQKSPISSPRGMLNTTQNMSDVINDFNASPKASPIPSPTDHDWEKGRNRDNSLFYKGGSEYQPR